MKRLNRYDFMKYGEYKAPMYQPVHGREQREQALLVPPKQPQLLTFARAIPTRTRMRESRATTTTTLMMMRRMARECVIQASQGRNLGCAMQKNGSHGARPEDQGAQVLNRHRVTAWFFMEGGLHGRLIIAIGPKTNRYKRIPKLYDI